MTTAHDQGCRVCGAAAPRHSFHLTRGPVEHCKACGVFISHDRSISEQQDSQFHASLDESKYVAYFEPFRSGQYRRVLTKLGVQPGKSLLDIGASFGWMVQVGLDLGLDAYGLEPSPMQYAEPLRGRIREATLEEHARDAGRRYDVVTMWHVMEHVRDPFASAAQIAQLLTGDGHAVIAVPSATGNMYRAGLAAARRLRQGRLMEELWYTHNANMHRYYFSKQALTDTLAQGGLEVVDAYTLDAFDWRRIWTRSTNVAGRAALRVGGPVLDSLGVTRNENLIVIARRTDPR
jgi:2-polyprenyl-3-methyl-5-hydroxy-6-metoxy-1,4-benzoquinol methylase